MMKRLNCPHCEKPGISVLRKLFLGPALPATCKACGKKVGVPYTASLMANTPFLAAFVASFFVESFVFKAALWVAGIIVVTIIEIRWVPLEPR